MIQDNPCPPAGTYYKKQIAAFYKISVRTLSRYLAPHAKEIGKPAGRRYYLPCQVRRIFEILGPPPD